MTLRQRGAGMLVVVLLVMTVAAFAVIVAASQSGGDVHGSDANADSMQALFLAESGIERALKRFATGTACNALGPETINDLATVGLGNGTHSIFIDDVLPQTDFAGVALPATQCRVRVTGTVVGRNISRTVHAIVDRNLLGAVVGPVAGSPVPPFNPGFDNPLAAAQPSSWALTPPITQPGYANNGGHSTAGACRRAAWVLKDRTNNYEARAQGVATVNFTATGGSQTTVTFWYRINDRGPNPGCLGGGNAANSPAADFCGGAAGNEGTACFRTIDSVGTNSTVGTFNANSTITQNVACPDNTGVVSAFATCTTGYAGAKGLTTFNIGGAGTRIITSFRYMMRLQANGRREMFLDYIEATNNTAVGAAHVRVWRDCSNALNPVTCV
jgi:hypothetical protein